MTVFCTQRAHALRGPFRPQPAVGKKTSTTRTAAQKTQPANLTRPPSPPREDRDRCDVAGRFGGKEREPPTAGHRPTHPKLRERVGMETGWSEASRGHHGARTQPLRR